MCWLTPMKNLISQLGTKTIEAVSMQFEALSVDRGRWRIWTNIAIVCLSIFAFPRHSIAQTQTYKVTTSHAEVVDKVGGGLLTLDGVFDQPATLVVILGGSDGGYLSTKTPLVMDLLFSGHRVAPVADHGATGTPKHLSEISIDAIASRIAALADTSSAAKGCVGIVGISKGGELTLLLASLSDIGDVHVAITPSDVVWQASNISFSRKSSWTHSGEPLAFVKYPRFSPKTFTAIRDVTRAGGLHALALEKTKDIEPMRIPVERATTPILLQAGTEDTLWPTAEMSNRLMARLATDKPDHKVELKTYKLDHFLIDHEKVRSDAVVFLNNHLASTCKHKE